VSVSRQVDLCHYGFGSKSGKLDFKARDLKLEKLFGPRQTLEQVGAEVAGLPVQ
jgi:hypothetical protein